MDGQALEQSPFIGRPFIGRPFNPLVSEPSPRNAEKMPYRGLAAVPPFALRGLRLRATVALAPGLPKQADSSRNGSGCPL